MIPNIKITVYSASNQIYDYAITNQTQGQKVKEVFDIVKKRYNKTLKIGLYRAGIRLLHFQPYSIKEVMDQFSNSTSKYNTKLMIIHNNLQFTELFDLKERKIKSAELIRNIAKKIPVVVQYDFDQEFCFQNFVLEDSTLIATLKALCKRKAQFSAIKFKGMFILLNRFERNEKLSNIRYLIQDDGFLHVFSSDTFNYELDNYLLQHNRMFLKYHQQLSQYYQTAVVDYNGKKRYYIFQKYSQINSEQQQQIQRKIFSLVCQYKFVFNNSNNKDYQSQVNINKKEHELVGDSNKQQQQQQQEYRQQIIRTLEKPFEDTVAIGFIYPRLYMIQRSNVLIVYDICKDWILVHRELPVPQSRYAYYQKIPVLLDPMLLMYEILRTNVIVHEFNLQGKLINYYEYEWNKQYQFVTTLTVDFVAVKVKPDLNKIIIWRIDDPSEKFQVDGEREACVFFNKIAFNMVSNKHEFAVYTPSNPSLCIYDFDLKQLKYKFACQTYLAWVSFSLSSNKIVYCNEFSDLYEVDLLTFMRKKYKKQPHTYYFYNEKEELLTMKKYNLIKLGEQKQPLLLNMDETVVICNNELYNLHNSMQHIRKIRLQNVRYKNQKFYNNNNKELLISL